MKHLKYLYKNLLQYVLVIYSIGRVQGQLYEGRRFKFTLYFHGSLIKTLFHKNPSLPLHLNQTAKSAMTPFAIRSVS